MPRRRSSAGIIYGTCSFQFVSSRCCQTFVGLAGESAPCLVLCELCCAFKSSLSQGEGSFYGSQQREGDVRAPGFPKILAWPSPAFPVSLHGGKVKRSVNNAGIHSWFLGTVHTLKNSKSLGFRVFFHSRVAARIPEWILGLNEQRGG